MESLRFLAFDRIGRLFLTMGLGLAVVVLAGGCKDKQVEAALESDANGFVCAKCSAKFYTAREFFPGHCPECKTPNIEQVMGFTCPVDNHNTLGPRSRGARRCEKCGGATAGVSIPSEAELKAWGAAKRTQAEVGGI